MAGNADLRFGTKDAARFFRVAVTLPQMDAVGAETLGQRDVVVDDEAVVVLR